MSLRGVLAAAGRTLIGLGILILLFVVYQLWGTGLSEARSQNALRHQLSGQLNRGQTATTKPTQTPSRASPSPNAIGGPAPPTRPPAEGDAVGIIRISKLGMDKVMVEGTGTADLHQGPGHYVGTPLPGQAGNSGIAGHRTTYGAPFYHLDELAPGDPILITTPQGTFRYDVTGSLVVKPTDISVLAPTVGNQLTLTTCTPRFSASQRLVVRASLEGLPAPSTPGPSAPTVTSKASPSNLASGTGPWPPAVAWGVAVVAGGMGLWLLARSRRHRWPVYLLGTPPLLVLLFLFFAAISKLLPASI